MPLTPAPTRRRRLAAVTAVTGLLAVLPVVSAGLPASAAPEEDCAEPFPLAEVTPDQVVEGLTVSRGTEPDPFTGRVLGVIRDGISPGVDMIIADLDSPAIDAAGGIWQGMSGSPVYAEDGRVLGAVSYGLAYGPSPIAGITPFEAMDDYLPATPPRVRLTPALAKRVADRTDVSARAAGQGLSELQVPLGVSGVPARVLERAAAGAADRSWFTRGAVVMGRAAAAPAGPTADDVEAGGNLAASLSYGDVALAGVGTATSVCDGRVVGFGHPLNFGGDDQTLGLHPADAVYVQPDSLGAPFKIANLADPVGTITDDHLTGLTGELGDVPDVVTVQTHIRSGARERLGTSYVSVPAALPEVAFYQILGNHATVLDEDGPGTETQAWTIEGFDSDGSPFTISYSNLYASDYSLLEDASYPLPDLLAQITAIDGVRITSVLNEIVVAPEARMLKIGRILQKRGNRMVVVTEEAAGRRAGRRHPAAPGQPGRCVTRPRVENLAFLVPRGVRGGEGALFVQGGTRR